jgi:hypothetical protein
MDEIRMTNVECCRGVCVKRPTNRFSAWHKRRLQTRFYSH